MLFRSDAKKQWDDYNTWRQNRNPERAELERLHGLDTKHACHLLRLLTMGKEILSEGRVYVDRRDRGDADYFRSVRDGKLTYPEIIALAESMDKELESLYQTSTLRHVPDLIGINKLLIDMQLDYWSDPVNV